MPRFGAARGEFPPRIVVVKNGEADLLEVIDALIVEGRLLVRRSVTDDGMEAPLPVRGELRGVL